jgi:hypothetical protein
MGERRTRGHAQSGERAGSMAEEIRR